jgi:hypothetical protein
MATFGLQHLQFVNMTLSYTPAATPADEEWRLQSLRDLNVLDSAPEAEFDAGQSGIHGLWRAHLFDQFGGC